MIKNVQNQLENLSRADKNLEEKVYANGLRLYERGSCQVLTHSKSYWDILVSDFDEEEEGEDMGKEIRINFSEQEVFPSLKNKKLTWTPEAVAALKEVEFLLGHEYADKNKATGKMYTREGMIKRVLEERRDKATKAKYSIKFADNIYGEHILTNERGVKFKITLRDFENKTGYIDNMDLKSNKLGTTKHIMYAFDAIEAKPRVFKKMGRTYPFVEVFLDPLNNYQITWFYPHALTPGISKLIQKYFGKKNSYPETHIKDFGGFLQEAKRFAKIKIRPEVEQKVQKAWDEALLAKIGKEAKVEFSFMKAKLFPYQKKGVQFAAFRSGAILADEMGLGKTIQSIATGILKKKHFGFKKCLIICPASLKYQWKKEIEKFSKEQAIVIEGIPKERRRQYLNSEAYFVITNYESVLRDLLDINQMGPDFVILDEAQRIKNFSTITAQNIKKIQKKHALAITGTPIENRLTDLYSIMQFVEPDLLTPLWEFSYQHCLFDMDKKDKITGYYNLNQLKDRLQPFLLRREKANVLKELPNVTEITVPVAMGPTQAEYHASFAKGVSQILHKKFISQFDLQRLMLLLANMRMVCDSSYLIDKETDESPKLAELEHILLEKIDILHSDRKIIIFSEWTQVLHMIGKMLQRHGIGYAQLSGKVAVKNRGQLVKKFETDDNCKVFLSTEAGGSGLNLQVADTVINFELPWNPAKKNQRIGRIDRIGQQKKQLTVINLITQNSIEISIAAGLHLKQSLFDGVLSTAKGPDFVDFSNSGKAQFLMELEAMLAALATEGSQNEDQAEPDETTEAAATVQSIQEVIAENAEEESEASRTAAASNESPGSDSAHMTEKVAAGATANPEPSSPAALETVLNSGMEFLSGLLQMATGQSMGLENKKVEVDQRTGEVVMRFKLPSFSK